ncbi:unnamed protein product [Bursaphelenchus xylophilus]|uniref:(pine wood nematode) hypothetical protein n=1 Tax=Bursaphelenchus xylophilus TaxID=6326 RepID=A0A1I7RHC8_BURXY|nr:unnamed protein product [Bursaphelenchus xylophilus]CAG9115844.1 unnamed protein product [Bursaphelenchus xylophilus]
MRGTHLIPFLFALGGFLVVSAQSFSYTRDCNDQQHREIHCVVRQVDCDEDEQIPQINDTARLPGEAHDIRVSNVVKAVSKRKGESYQLSVDISWQTPPNNSTLLLNGFLLEINSEDGKQHQCFLLDVNGSTWTDNAVKLSPRLHFFTESLFRFSQNYEISVHSLPEGVDITRTATKTVQMPHHPRSFNQSDILPSNCSHSSHPFASQWAAGFRRVLVYPLTRTVHIEFIAAPPEYCFEQYEIRLMDATVMLVERSTIISLDQLIEEDINGTVNYIGYVNFTDVELNKTYTPTVIPVETSVDGRCLCPVHSQGHLKSTNVVCTCVNSESKRIRLIKIDATKTICMGCSNETKPILETEISEDESQTWLYHLGIFLLIIILLFVFGITIVMIYQKYRTWGKSFRIQLIHDRNPSRSPNVQTSDLQTKALLKPAGSLLRTANLNVLIIYSHDSNEHDLAVLFFAEYLRDAFNMEVHLDILDSDLIHKNLMDYLSSSVINADYVMIINSLGTAKRYQTKIQSLGAENQSIVQRNEAGPFDKLFVSQIDMALQHQKIISVRFNYSNFEQVLPPLNGRLQYVIPDNLGPLLSALHNTNLKDDPRLIGFTPQLVKLKQAIETMAKRISTDPEWFTSSHHSYSIPRRSLESPKALPEVPVLQTYAESDPLLESGVSCSSTSSLGSTTDVNNYREIRETEIDKTGITVPQDLDDNYNDTHDSGNFSHQYTDNEMSSELYSKDRDVLHDHDRICEQATGQLEDRLHPQEDLTLEYNHEQTRLEPEKLLGKWNLDPNSDSGLVSDADLQLISSS